MDDNWLYRDWSVLTSEYQNQGHPLDVAEIVGKRVLKFCLERPLAASNPSEETGQTKIVEGWKLFWLKSLSDQVTDEGYVNSDRWEEVEDDDLAPPEDSRKPIIVEPSYSEEKQEEEEAVSHDSSDDGD